MPPPQLVWCVLNAPSVLVGPHIVVAWRAFNRPTIVALAVSTRSVNCILKSVLGRRARRQTVCVCARFLAPGKFIVILLLNQPPLQQQYGTHLRHPPKRFGSTATTRTTTRRPSRRLYRTLERHTHTHTTRASLSPHAPYIIKSHIEVCCWGVTIIYSWI